MNSEKTFSVRLSLILFVMLFCVSGCVLFAPVPLGRIEAIEDSEADEFNKAVISYNKGVAALVKDDFQDAVKSLESAIKTFPDLFEANLVLGLVYDLFLEQPQKAREIFRQLLKKDPDDTRLKKLLREKGEGVRRAPGKGVEEAEEPSGPVKTKVGAIIRARSALRRASYSQARRDFEEALDEELSYEEEMEVLTGLGIAYAALRLDEASREKFTTVLYNNPRATLPEKTYPDRVYTIFNALKLDYPAPVDLKIDRKSVLVFAETVSLEVNATAPCVLALRITPLGEKDVLLDKKVELKKDNLTAKFEWLVGESPGFALRPRTYKISVTSHGKKDWSWTREYLIGITGNFDAKEVAEVARKEDRYRALQGQLPLTHIPGRKRWELVEVPKQFSWKGFLSYPYYGTVGAIRDGLDFPIKALYSVPGLGHALTVVHPALVFVMVDGAQGVKKDEYESIFWGPLSDADEKYKSDKQAAKGNAALAAVASFVAIPAIMSVFSWAGTDDGIAKGFYSYYDSNAFQNGYKQEYFFPNWRSMDFTVIKDDPVKEKKLLRQAKEKNARLNGEIEAANKVIDSFNLESYSKWRFDLYKNARKSLEQILQIDMKLGKGTDVEK